MASEGKVAFGSDCFKMHVLYSDWIMRTVMCVSVCCNPSLPLLIVSLLFCMSHFREEYGRLFDFVNGKHLRIKNTGKVRYSSKLFRPSTVFSLTKIKHDYVMLSPLKTPIGRSEFQQGTGASFKF